MNLQLIVNFARKCVVNISLPEGESLGLAYAAHFLGRWRSNHVDQKYVVYWGALMSHCRMNSAKHTSNSSLMGLYHNVLRSVTMLLTFNFMPNWPAFLTFACIKWKKSCKTNTLGTALWNPSAKASSKSNKQYFGLKLDFVARTNVYNKKQLMNILWFMICDTKVPQRMSCK